MLPKHLHAADLAWRQGTPAQPRCGFSSKVVQALGRTGLPFGTFDILQDEAVRQGLKAYSDWPTYPQLYAGQRCFVLDQAVHACDVQ